MVVVVLGLSFLGVASQSKDKRAGKTGYGLEPNQHGSQHRPVAAPQLDLIDLSPDTDRIHSSARASCSPRHSCSVGSCSHTAETTQHSQSSIPRVVSIPRLSLFRCLTHGPSLGLRFRLRIFLPLPTHSFTSFTVACCSLQPCLAPADTSTESPDSRRV